MTMPQQDRQAVCCGKTIMYEQPVVQQTTCLLCLLRTRALLNCCFCPVAVVLHSLSCLQDHHLWYGSNCYSRRTLALPKSAHQHWLKAAEQQGRH
jgi:hypothetical protein